MSTAQKIIKYCAIAFALFLTVSIIGGIVGALSTIPVFLDSDDNVGEMKTYSVNGNVESLEIDLSGAQLEIKTGNKFSVESNHKHLNLDNKDGVLKVQEEKTGIGFHSDRIKIILTVPERFNFQRADISTGAGTIKIDTLLADKLSLDLGAGEADIHNLVANVSSKINGGAGELSIAGGELANLNFDMGIGEVNLESRLTGDCEIDYGVGELNLTLIGTQEDYSITLDKGVGSATLDGQKMNDGVTYGNGNTDIEIDGGVGELYIRFGI